MPCWTFFCDLETQVQIAAELTSSVTELYLFNWGGIKGFRFYLCEGMLEECVCFHSTVVWSLLKLGSVPFIQRAGKRRLTWIQSCQMLNLQGEISPSCWMDGFGWVYYAAEWVETGRVGYCKTRLVSGNTALFHGSLIWMSCLWYCCHSSGIVELWHPDLGLVLRYCVCVFVWSPKRALGLCDVMFYDGSSHFTPFPSSPLLSSPLLSCPLFPCPVNISLWCQSERVGV